MHRGMKSAGMIGLFATTLAAASVGQTLVWQLPPPAMTGASFGWALAPLGDLDGDAVLDIAVAAPAFSSSGPGDVHVFSGATGVLVRVISGPATAQRFGYALDATGDVDGDGVDDLLIGAPGATGGSFAPARAYVHSGATGALLREHVPNIANSGLGTAVSGLDDVDGDGVDDYLIGVPQVGLSNLDGRIALHSGATGALIYNVLGASGYTKPGISLDAIGDVNGDSIADFVAGCANSNTSTYFTDGKVIVCSGANGAVLHVIDGPTTNDGFGVDLAALGDVDADGRGDFVVGTFGATPNGSHPGTGGAAYVHSGATGALIRELIPSEFGGIYGQSVAGGGDLDHDGVGDVLVAAPELDVHPWNPNDGRIWAFSGATGELLFYVERLGVPGIGVGLASLSDLDADGFVEFGIGAPQTGGAASGRAWIFSPCPLPPRVFCTAKTNSLGCVPQIAFTGSASLTSASAFTIGAANILNNKTGTLFYGTNGPAAVPFQGGQLCSVGPHRRTPYQSSGGSSSGDDCTGAFSLDFRAHLQSGVDPALTLGVRVDAQYWSRDPQDAHTTNLTDAVEFVICPK